MHRSTVTITTTVIITIIKNKGQNPLFFLAVKKEIFKNYAD